jgi:hypothetical protein
MEKGVNKMADKNLLHQLLAVKADLEREGGRILAESINTFTKKAEHFDGVMKVYESKDAEGDQIPPETKEIVTTVSDKIKYTQGSVVKAIDARVSMEETNASGTVNAELKVGDKSFGTFSAISLLALEEWLEKVRALYKEIPTLDPTKHWDADTSAGANRYKTPEEIKFRTVKKNKPLVLAPATDKHPAQVQLVQDEEQVGQYKTTYSSGRITPSQKSDLLQKIDDLILAVKDAKAKANTAQVNQIKIGDDLFNFINDGIL